MQQALNSYQNFLSGGVAYR